MHVIPAVEDALRALIDDRIDAFLEQISHVEDGLAQTPLDLLAARTSHQVFRIREYDDELAGDFRDISAEWINAGFHLESADKEVLDHPREKIIDSGGVILFVDARGLGIIGTCRSL